MRKVTVLAASAIIAAAIAVPAIAGAQEESPTDETTTEGRSGQRFTRGGGAKFATVADTIGIPLDELREQLVAGLTVAEIAEANGFSAEAVSDALLAELESHLAGHVSDGDLTQAEVDTKLATADERIDDLLNGVTPAGGLGHRGSDGRSLGSGFGMSSTLPDLLGIDATEMMTQLRDGASIAEVAEANGVAVGDVIDAMVGEANERLETAVADGDITEEQATEMLDEITERITGVVNGEALFGRGGLGHEGRRHGESGSHEAPATADA